jgi:thiol-disulfide isomerase/thioredoxin
LLNIIGLEGLRTRPTHRCGSDNPGVLSSCVVGHAELAESDRKTCPAKGHGSMTRADGDGQVTNQEEQMSTEHPQHGALSAIDTANVWLNSEPLTAERLHGRVVLVDFWTYSCVNWLRTLPYTRAWDERYRDRGLVVVGAHAPEFGFEHDLDNLRRAIRELGVGYPVVVDNEFTIWRSFENHYWPAVYLVDRDGEVRFHHFGEGAYEETERAIQRLLGVEEENVRVDAGGVAEAADWDTLGSPETYLGSARGERRSDPRDNGLALNDWALAGAWSVGREAAVLDASAGSVAYRFQARDLNLVLAPPAADAHVRFSVRLDGQPPGDAHGLDVDAAGAGTVSEARMYQLVRQRAAVGERDFEITFLEPGARAYVFTFG